MKLKKTNVLIAVIGSGIFAILFAVGPHPTNVAMEVSIFFTKCSIVLLLLGLCMENEQ